MWFEGIDTAPPHLRLRTATDERAKLVVFQNSKSLIVHFIGAGVHLHCEVRRCELEKMLTGLKPAVTTFPPLNG